MISVEADLPFRGTWTELVERSSQWVADPDEEKRALEILRPRLERVADALSQPYHQWLTEDYYVVHVCGLPCSGQELLERHGMHIAQIVRGEATALSADECEDVLKGADFVLSERSGGDRVVRRVDLR